MRFTIDYNIITDQTNVTEQDIEHLEFTSKWIHKSFDIDDYILLEFKDKPLLNKMNKHDIYFESSDMDTYVVYAKKGYELFLNNHIFIVSENDVIIQQPTHSHQHIKLH